MVVRQEMVVVVWVVAGEKGRCLVLDSLEMEQNGIQRHLAAMIDQVDEMSQADLVDEYRLAQVVHSSVDHRSCSQMASIALLYKQKRGCS